MSVEDKNEFLDSDGSSLNNEEQIVDSEEDDDFTDSEHSQGVGKSFSHFSIDEIPGMLKELNELGVQALKNPDDTD